MRQRIFIALILAVALGCGAKGAGAHEFWIAPQRYTVEPGARVQAALLVGLMMRGTELPYLSGNFDLLTVTTRSGAQPVRGLEGDLPAISYAATEPGLHVIAYHAKPNQVTYERWEQFLQSLAYEGLEAMAEAHRARGLPETGIKEAYSRSAKSLVRVGETGAQDGDRALGLPLELVAEDNPYEAGRETIAVRLLRLGQPVAGRQVAIYRNDGHVRRTLVATDAQGRATIPIKGGGGFLLNAVDLQPLDAGDAVWASEWASLTFGLPIVRPEHPLDPLSPLEIAEAVRVVGGSGRVDASARAALVTLAEPEKQRVLAWRPGEPAARKAFAVIRNGKELFEATVDLATRALERWQAVPGAQPPIRSDEWAAAQRLVKEDPRWLAAMRARGYADVSQVFCESLSAGYFDREEDRGRRLLKMPCYDIAEARTNIYGRPIEGLLAVVDLDEGAVVRVQDEGAAPVSTGPHGFDEASLTGLRLPLRPVRTTAPAGWNFTVEDRVVAWAGWSFHLGFDQRFGPVLSLVAHEDGPARRMVLYQGHLSEVFVPYMDASEGWYFRSYMDAGEYGLGTLASPLHAGLDCPEGAPVFDAALVRPNGEVYTRERVMCLFERDAAAPLWRHWEALNGAYEARPATELVLRSIPTVGNYDYVMDWVFTQAGEIRIDLGATGIAAVKGVAADSTKAAGAAEATRTGTLVAPNLVAVHHDHFFSFRLDLDIDGPDNSFVREHLAPASLPPEAPRRSAWRVETVPMPLEGALSAHHGAELWRIENPAAETRLGHRRSYQIEAHGGATSLLAADDWPQRRAGFSAETLWVTARHPGELFAGGPYPNQSRGGDGLPAYVNGESVVSSDLVAWATLGFHHVTRPEDWPVVPTVWHSLRLRPFGFFETSPALTVRRELMR